MRTASFTFDDGLINTAKKVANLNIPATFYLVTGWLHGVEVIDDFYNIELDHGIVADWSKFDIGSHTIKHDRKFDELECLKDFRNTFHRTYNHLATPYGIKHTAKYFDTCKIGYVRPYNKMNLKDLSCLSSINPNYDLDKPSLKNVIENCPDACWIIFTFHGIDEGWKPTTVTELLDMYNKLLDEHYRILTISEVVDEISARSYLL